MPVRVVNACAWATSADGETRPAAAARTPTKASLTRSVRVVVVVDVMVLSPVESLRREPAFSRSAAWIVAPL